MGRLPRATSFLRAFSLGAERRLDSVYSFCSVRSACSVCSFCPVFSVRLDYSKFRPFALLTCFAQFAPLVLFTHAQFASFVLFTHFAQHALFALFTHLAQFAPSAKFTEPLPFAWFTNVYSFDFLPLTDLLCIIYYIFFTNIREATIEEGKYIRATWALNPFLLSNPLKRIPRHDNGSQKLDQEFTNKNRMSYKSQFGTRPGLVFGITWSQRDVFGRGSICDRHVLVYLMREGACCRPLREGGRKWKGQCGRR